jgi:hypothetical protein
VLVGVRWSETAEVGDRRLSKKDPRVGGTEKLDDEVSSLLLGGGAGHVVWRLIMLKDCGA